MSAVSSIHAAALAIKSAHIITLAEAEAAGPLDGYLVVNDDGLVEAVTTDAPATGTPIIDVGDQIVMPGFVSGHNHLWQAAFRGLATDQELYGWLKALHWTYGKHFKDGDMYAFTLHGALDQVRHGITTTLNHSQSVAPTYAQYLEQFDAELDAGQNFVFSYVFSREAESAEERRAGLVDILERIKAQTAEPPLCLGASIHGTGIYGRGAAMGEEAALAKEFGLEIQIHYLEEKAQSLGDGREIFPRIVESGLLDAGLQYAHFIHVTDEILSTSAEKGASMMWNPLSNGRLASGLPEINKYREAGLRVGMGVDGAASADLCDPFQNMRMGMYALRMRDSDASVMSAYEILRLHTFYTAEILGVDDRVGTLEPGKRADFLVIDPNDPATGPIFNVYAHLVTSCDASNIASVWINGEKQVDEGRSLHHDSDLLAADVAMRVERIVAAATSE